jgi:polyferredoxin
LMRIKPLAFASVMIASGSAMAWGVANMSNVDAALEHQRQPPFVKLSDGSIRNDYALRFAHRGGDITGVGVSVEGLAGASVRVSSAVVSEPAFTPGHRRSVSERVMITVPKAAAPQGRVPVTLVLTDTTTKAPLARFSTYFWGPGGAQ